VTITATQAVQVTAISATGPFTTGTPSQSLPASLGAGGSMTVPVTFTPTAAGSANGLLQVSAATSGNPPANYQFSLHGTGTAPGLAATPAPVAFGTVGTTQSGQRGVTIQNTGSTTTTITSVAGPIAP